MVGTIGLGWSPSPKRTRLTFSAVADIVAATARRCRIASSYANTKPAGEGSLQYHAPSSGRPLEREELTLLGRLAPGAEVRIARTELVLSRSRGGQTETPVGSTDQIRSQEDLSSVLTGSSSPWCRRTSDPFSVRGDCAVAGPDLSDVGQSIETRRLDVLVQTRLDNSPVRLLELGVPRIIKEKKREGGKGEVLSSWAREGVGRSSLRYRSAPIIDPNKRNGSPNMLCRPP